MFLNDDTFILHDPASVIEDCCNSKFHSLDFEMTIYEELLQICLDQISVLLLTFDHTIAPTVVYLSTTMP